MNAQEFRAALAGLGLRPYAKETARILGVRERSIARYLAGRPVPVTVQTVLVLLDALASKGYPPTYWDPGVHPRVTPLGCFL